ncbi:UDP-N-acetylmuramoyl-tripeptide--D-alanyl-D-alanine ligase [Cytobacillus sp. Hz8]|uniref:UDP-N-acetylmuramoyl-tripeptide--D-alanyl-D- alanine ligase n=1 Tax=Cytobacillus sp. Hz8 TaxID=3347168 RepID=UPI0035D53CB0
MIKRTLKQITSMMKVENDVNSFSNLVVHGVCIDSRKIDKGNLFIPLKGEKMDGHRFVEAAIEDGAAAALWQKDVPNPPTHLPILIVEDTEKALQELARSYRNQLNVKVVGITGSNGKTTTKDMAASLLSLKYKVQKTEGNFNNHIGLPLTVLSLNEDTEIAVLEMGMSAKGEIEFLSNLGRPDLVVITNIGESHLQDLGSRESIADAKTEILSGLRENGIIIYNGDEPLLKERLQKYGHKWEIHTFGRNAGNTLYPTHMEQNNGGSLFTINQSNSVFNLPVLGGHNILNALAAMLVAHSFQIPFEDMNEGLKELKLTNMRMELVEGEKGERIINDAYNASPTSMRAAIELVSNLTGFTNRILVLGDMLELGPNEEKFHFEIGQSLNPQKINYVFTYGKLGKYIADGAKTSLKSERVFHFTDKSTLSAKIREYTNAQTLILVKASRGMRLEEVVHTLMKKNK